MALISLRNVSLAFGGPKLLDDASLQVEQGDRICLLGRNGTGKSTLLRLINQEVPADAGTIDRQQGLRVALVAQEVPAHLQGSIRDNLRADADQEHVWQKEHGIDQVLSHLQLDGDADVATLSGGMKRRVLLAQALCSEPDILLLDEPTNHLDIATIAWLEEFLLRLRTTLIFVSHDRMFARRLATRIVELDRGHLYCFECGYDEFLQRREDLLNAEQKEWARFDQKLAEEEIWIRKGIKARRTRNEGRVRALQKMRNERSQRRDRIGKVKMQLQTGERSGQMVAEAKDVSFCYETEPIISNLSLRIMRGDRIGIIGPNGAGKSTLLKLLLDQLQPSEGSLRHGTNLQVVYFDQLREQLDEEKTVQENVAGTQDHIMIGGNSRHVIGYLQDFLFSPERSRTPVKVLSGGERNRLLLARLFTRQANLLVLDEPTNDLDVETLDLLEELIMDFAGTVLLVSHDRTFLNNLVTSCLVCQGNGVVEESVGGYDDWLMLQQEKLNDEKRPAATKREKDKAERPRKLKFKEKQELAVLPQTIDRLENEQAELHELMADPKFYQQGGGAAVREKQDRLAEIELLLNEAYQRWEELDAIPE
ncbi:MAG TPA: ATP-binding cassette domain-containing protein [Geopsychrobacteraceae bacterium]|nr:ATP-binding cassette domain-containing protein [Geopsychrobacteraceae bacterium]